MRKILIILLVLVGAAVFIWPTRYKNYDAGEGPYAAQAGSFPTRVDRTTGAVYVRATSGDWKPLKGARPELLRPDITGPSVETRVDTAPAVQQGRSIEKMQDQTSQMEAAARAGAVK
jgi:hypothetical protein